MLDVIGRERELLAVDRLLGELADGPALLVFEGEPGIGKTTIMRAAAERAAARGVQVLSCAGAVAEARLSYVALADLLKDVDEAALAKLPALQREALDAALLRAGSSATDADPRAVSSAVVSLLEQLGREQPVLVVIDDLQWLDPSSAQVLDFCARRLSGRTGIAATQRPPAAGVGPGVLSQVPGLRLEHLAPLDDEALAALLRGRRDRPPGRRALARVVEAAGGNPLYAIELLRALPPDELPAGPLSLPPTLSEIVASRLAGLGPDVQELLLAVAALSRPTLGVITDVLGDESPALVLVAEEQGVLERIGERLRFSHPLLAEGALARAPATQRRAMHRRLSEVVTDAEDRARHLALAGIVAEALPALDTAARYTRARGAPLAAAELLELALELGGDASLKVRAAEHHLDAGDVPRAQDLLEAATTELPHGEERARALTLLGELRTRADSFVEARALLEQARAEALPGSPLQVSAGLELVFVLYSLRLRREAAQIGHAVLDLAERLGVRGLIASALGVVATVDFALGRGLDERAVRRALALENPQMRTSNVFRPTLTASMVLGFAGRVDEAAVLLAGLCDECRQRSEEHDLAWLLTRLVQLNCWRGHLDEARAQAGEAERKLLPLGTVNGRMLALSARAQVEAYSGEAEEARRIAEEALALAEETSWSGAAIWQHITLGFLELSVGNSEAAAERLAPFVSSALESGLPEPAEDGALVHGDAAEALILVGRVEDAEPLVQLLEQRGGALDRAWAIAVGARCRALILAAAGEVEEAAQVLERALSAHERLPMPIEHARTLLALGRVQRRMNERRAAKRTLEQALSVFERVGSVRWADQASSELAALGLRAGPRDSLTPSEERVARLAASGLTNRQIASTLQISPKTVDAHLGRVYRKLDIRSRAELGARMASGEVPAPSGAS